jgi:hypothetical protein
MSSQMSYKNYWKPTPKRWRMVGDGLLAVASIVTVGGLLGFDLLQQVFNPKELKYIIGLSFGCGVAGKFLTNFFKVNVEADQPDQI